jgi:hypothetical protein
MFNFGTSQEFKMNLSVNESGLDRMIRAVFGVVLFYLGIAGVVQGTLGVILLVIGVILIATAAIGFCPIYKLINFKTNK